MVEARHEREGPGARQAPVSRLEAKDAAEGARHADRAVGVRSERDRDEAARDRGARAAGRAARHMVEIVRIAGGAVVRVLAGEVIGVFAHVQRADEDGARAFEARDQGGVLAGRRPLAVDLRAGAGRQARDIEEVLDGERRAGQRAQAFAASARGVDRLGLRERARRSHIGERAERTIARFDARERRFALLRGRSPRRS